MPGLLLVLLLVSFPASVAAQHVSSFVDLSRVVKRNQQIQITDVTGDKTRGSIADISDATITLRVGDGRRTFERATIATIRRSDRLWNGALIGAGAGLAGTEIWVHSLCGRRDSECSAIARGVGWMTFVPGGAVVGALIDKAIGGQVIYQTSRRTVKLPLSPSIGTEVVAMGGRVTF